MLREYSHTKCESLVQIRTTKAQIQHFSRRLLLAHPVIKLVLVYNYLCLIQTANKETPAIWVQQELYELYNDAYRYDKWQ